MDHLLPYIVVDATVIVLVALIGGRRLSFFHPLFFYLFFHAYSFSFRAIELYQGKYPLYFGMQTAAFYSAIRPEEFTRGLIIADIALVCFAVGSFFAHKRGNSVRTPQQYHDKALIYIAATLIPLGTFFLITRRYGIVIEPLQGLQITNVARIWPVACLALLISRYGFRWYWLVLVGGYLAVVGTQGYHRFMALLPLLLMVAIYLVRKGRQWPGPTAWGVLLAAALIFPTLKDFGRVYQDRGLVAAVETLGGTPQGYDDLNSTRTEMFFDMFAGALTQADGLETPLLGETYIALLTLPIPRKLWADKPSLGGAALAVAAPGRPFDVEGRIVTIIGESYINFKHMGVIVILGFLGFFLTRYYIAAFSIPELDPYKVAYLGLMTTFLQVFRDGLPSLVLFSIIAMFPIYLYVFLVRRRHRAGIPMLLAEPVPVVVQR